MKAAGRRVMQCLRKCSQVVRIKVTEKTIKNTERILVISVKKLYGKICINFESSISIS